MAEQKSGWKIRIFRSGDKMLASLALVISGSARSTSEYLCAYLMCCKSNLLTYDWLLNNITLYHVMIKLDWVMSFLELLGTLLFCSLFLSIKIFFFLNNLFLCSDQM